MSEKVNLIDFSDIFKTVGVDSDQESYVETHEWTHTTSGIYILITPYHANVWFLMKKILNIRPPAFQNC